MYATQKLEPFDIRNFIDRLQPSKHKGRFFCPSCGNDNLTISLQSGAYQCWTGCECKLIRDAIAPLGEKQFKKVVPFKTRPNKKTKLPPPPPPGEVRIIRSGEAVEPPATKQIILDQKLGEVTITTYPYMVAGDGKLLSWVMRKEWQDSSKAKGRTKEIYPWYIATEDTEVKGKQYKVGDPVCGKVGHWQAYRLDAAIAAGKLHSGVGAALVQEGEKVVELGYTEKIASFTFQGSAYTVAEMIPSLERFKLECPDHILVFLLDADKAGRAKGAKFLEACAIVGIYGLVIEPLSLCENLNEGDDIEQLLQQMTADELIEILERQIRETIQQTNTATSHGGGSNNSDDGGDDDDKKPALAQGSLASYIAERYRDRLAWNVHLKEWFRYSGEIEGIWSKEPEEYIWQIVMAEVETQTDGYKSDFISGIVKLLKAHLAVRKWDEIKNLIPLLNGVLNPKTMELSPHAPGHRLTWCLPYEYDPSATCEPIAEWLKEAVKRDEQQVELLRAYLCAVVTGRTDLQRYLELVGPGGTGKSTYIRLAMALIGVRNTHISTLQKLEGSRFETACIEGKRLVVVTDSERYAGNVSVLKALTGQDPLPYEVKFKQSTGGYLPKAMVIVAANEVIQSGDYTSGLTRRRLSVPFTNEISELEQRNLIEFAEGELQGEFLDYLPGLLNWVLAVPSEMVTNLVKRTSEFVPSLSRAKAITICQTNPIADWADLHLVVRPDYRQSVGTAQRDKNHESPYFYLDTDRYAYASYAEFCAGSGNKPVSCLRFVKLLEDLFKSQLKISGIIHSRDRFGGYFKGIKIRSDEDLDPCLISGNNPPPPPPSNPLPPLPPLPPSSGGNHPPDGSTPPPPPSSPPDGNAPSPDSIAIVNCDGLVATVTDSVTDQSRTGDGCDGCDGLLEKSENINSEIVEQRVPDDQNLLSENELADHPSQPSQEAKTPSGTGFNPSQVSVTHPSQSITFVVSESTATENQPVQVVAPVQVGDRVRVCRRGSKFASWVGVVEAIDGDRITINYPERIKAGLPGTIVTALSDVVRVVEAVQMELLPNDYGF